MAVPSRDAGSNGISNHISNDVPSEDETRRDRAADETFELHVETGPYAGLVHRCEGRIVTIGSDAEADIALVAEEIEPVHLRVEGHADATSVQALGPRVTVSATMRGAGRNAASGTGGVAQAAEPTVGLPVELAVDERLDDIDPAYPITVTIDGLTMRFARLDIPAVRSDPLLMTGHAMDHVTADAVAAPYPSAPDPSVPGFMHPSGGDDGRRSVRQRGRRYALLFLPIALALVVFLLDGGGSPGPTGTSGVPITVPPAASPSVDTAGVDRAALSLRRQLDARELDGVTLRRDGRMILATGTLSPADHERWSGVQAWFDARHVTDATLVSQVEIEDEEPGDPPRIDAVWTGEDPHVISRGTKYMVGTLLPDGWSLTAIGDDHVVVERRGRVLRMEL